MPGATDRDGNNAKTGINANTYKLLANDLGKNGIASVRYDKRMVGESVSTTKEAQLCIDDYGDDAVGLVNMLNDACATSGFRRSSSLTWRRGPR